MHNQVIYRAVYVHSIQESAQSPGDTCTAPYDGSDETLNSSDDDEVTRLEKVRAQSNIRKVIDIWRLKDYTDDYQAMSSLAQGNDGKLLKIFIEHVPHVVKFYKTGVNAQYVTFQQTLMLQRDSADAQRQPGYEDVYYIAVPVGYVLHKDNIGLVFHFVIPPREAEDHVITVGDRAQLWAQIQFLHWLGFCHLDITARNVLLGRGGKCYLLDYDCVCALGRSPLGPLPPESSKAILRRDPADVLDDVHLWQQLQHTYFKDLPTEDTVSLMRPLTQYAATGQCAVKLSFLDCDACVTFCIEICWLSSGSVCVTPHDL